MTTPTSHHTILVSANAANARRDPTLPPAALAGIQAALARNAANVAHGGGPALAGGRVSALRGDWRGLPPCCFHCGEAEALRDDAVRGAAAARAAGVASVTLVVEEWGFHEMPCFCNVIPEAMAAAGRIATFCRRALAYRAGVDAAAARAGAPGPGILSQVSPSHRGRRL